MGFEEDTSHTPSSTPQSLRPPSLPMSLPPPLLPLPPSLLSPSPSLDDSFGGSAWDKTPKTSKLGGKAEKQHDKQQNRTHYKQEASEEGGAVSHDAQQDNSCNQPQHKGRRVRLLKPKQKTLDFWGTSSAKPSVQKSKEAVGAVGGVEGAVETEAAAAAAAAVTVGLSPEYFGPLGVFGDDTYLSDGERGGAGTGTGAGGIGTDEGSYLPYYSTSSAPSRLPQGWLAGITMGGDVAGVGGGSTAAVEGGRGRAASADFSFFELGEEELEDPILKQVAYNKSHPDEVGNKSNTARAIQLLASFSFLTHGEEGGGDAGENVAGNGGSGGGSSGGGSSGSGGGGGVSSGGCIVGLLQSLEGVGVSTRVVSGDQIVFTSRCWGDGESCGTRRERGEESSGERVEGQGGLFDVLITLPQDWDYGAVLLMLLQCLRLLIVLLMALLLRGGVLLVGAVVRLVRWAVTRIGGGGSSSDSSGGSSGSGSLRRFFSSDTADSILGHAPDDLTWQQRTAQQARSAALAFWAQLNSGNGILVLTLVLLLYSYYKFRRYGTDAGD
ncbi:hypothetical protein B484DRAFT_446593 [Ochromonadaceae sp. CCMP2298]|nr:hypothetical protein B484DRAFT_446593 [Ochromonadaceae sp. CCMP2298]